MKIFGLVLSTLFLLATPCMAAVYRGKNIDGIKLAGKVYFSQTGGVYKVHVSFDKNLATIYFDNGGQTTIQLRQNVITDPNNIEGYGAIGQYYLSRSFSIGLAQSDDSIGNFGWQGSRDIQGLWIISLDKNASLDATNAKKP